jgi:hypothetical protein
MDQANLIRAGTPGTTGVISSEPCDERSNQAAYAAMFRYTPISAEFWGRERHYENLAQRTGTTNEYPDVSLRNCIKMVFSFFSPALSLFNITREAHDQQKLQIFINTVFRYHSVIWRRRTVLKYTQNAVEIAHGTDRICRKDYGWWEYLFAWTR